MQFSSRYFSSLQLLPVQLAVLSEWYLHFQCWLERGGDSASPRPVPVPLRITGLPGPTVNLLTAGLPSLPACATTHCLPIISYNYFPLITNHLQTYLPPTLPISNYHHQPLLLESISNMANIFCSNHSCLSPRLWQAAANQRFLRSFLGQCWHVNSLTFNVISSQFAFLDILHHFLYISFNSMERIYIFIKRQYLLTGYETCFIWSIIKW